MLEWIGVCCCSSFVSCICSLIATTFCLSPNGVYLRKNMTPDHKARNGNPKRSTMSKIAGHNLEIKTNGLKSRRFPIPRSRFSCECVNFEKFPEIRHRSSFDDGDNYPTSYSPDIYNDPENKTATFLPCSKLCRSNYFPQTSAEIARDLDPQNNIELRKRVDEYDAIFKRLKDLIEDQSNDKKVSGILNEEGVSVQNNLPVINTSKSTESTKVPDNCSEKSSSLMKPLNQQFVANCCEILDNEGKVLINKINENYSSVGFYPNYNNKRDYESRGVKDFRPPISPAAQFIESNNTNPSSTRGWQYKMKRNVRKVCGRMIRGDCEKRCEFRNEDERAD